MTGYIDGAARGNPGPAGAGAYFPGAGGGGEPLELFEALGIATNNEAEYRALLLALKAVQRDGSREATIYSDSKLLVEQMHGRYRVKAENLKPLHAEALRRARELKSFRLSHIPRDKNREADRLANRGADLSERR